MRVGVPAAQFLLVDCVSTHCPFADSASSQRQLHWFQTSLLTSGATTNILTEHGSAVGLSAEAVVKACLQAQQFLHDWICSSEQITYTLRGRAWNANKGASAYLPRLCACDVASSVGAMNLFSCQEAPNNF